MPDWRVVEAQNQVRFRAVNERVSRHRTEGGAARSTYVCECGDTSCRDPLELTPDEYEAVRSEGAWFLVATHHEDPEVERVVVEHPRYSTVAKLPGASGQIARMQNPRAS